MKKLLKGKWFPLAATSVLVIVLFVFLYWTGFRVTYAPDLENSWDAVSAFAAWGGVAMSFVAMMTAIWTPIRIANRQDKIALFEKRMECYNTIQNLLVIARQMEDVQINKGIQVAFRVYLGLPENIVDNISATGFAVRLKQKEAIIVSGEFLFPNYNTELLQKIINVGVSLIMQTAVHDIESANTPLSAQAAKLKKEYCQLCKQYENAHLESMEKELRLDNAA